MIKKVLFLITLLLVISCHKKSTRINNTNTHYKNISELIKASKNTAFTDSIRNEYLNKGIDEIEKLNSDSLKLRSYVKVAYSNLLLGNWENYKKNSYEILARSILINDSLNLAKAQSYLGYYYQNKFKPDSAFYFYTKALKSFSLLNNKLEEGKMLLSMATIQENVKDYTGSEINSIKAISKLKNLKQFRSLYLAYNNLGVVYSKLGSFKLAIENHHLAIKYLKKHSSSKFLKSMSLNNIGKIYEKDREYQKAISFYDKGIRINNLLKSKPQIFAVLLDNMAYSKFKLGQLDEFPELFYKSLNIRDSLNIKDGQVVSNRHLSEYYLSQSDTLTALKHARISKNIAEESNYNEGLLDSYILLSKLEPNKKGKEYLNKYIKLSDSLQHQERAIREKFTRIAYETDEIILEKEEEIKKKWYVILISGLGASFSILLITYMRQRSRNNELEFKQEQDKANVEIYNLMLSQQKMFNEGSIKEKNRISQELHDGVLGRLFGTRLSLDAINESKYEDDIAAREKNIEELKSIEEDIRKISHNLKTSIFDNDTSFKMLVEQLVAKQSKIIKFEYNLSFDNHSNWENIPNNIKINCYRILQESIQNINKYSLANNVKIIFTKENGYLLFQIEDDGMGFNIKKTNEGIGIKNIKSRVNDLKGQVKFISKSQTGTKIHIKIPIPKEFT